MLLLPDLLGRHPAAQEIVTECLDPRSASPTTWPVVPWKQDCVFPGRVDGGEHISTRQYARLVGDWGEGIGPGRSACGTHGLRRTKVALIYKPTGNLRAVQILLRHTKLESTVRYLGADAEDAPTLYEGAEV